MPILLVALLALAAFGIIGIFLGAAVALEQRKVIDKDHHTKAA
jgi:ABC-type dipeptide/oligopeptide/nickel transport system permease component